MTRQRTQSGSSDSEAREGPVPNKSGIGLLSKVAVPKGTQLELVYGVFGYMQVLSACFLLSSNGGNDMSNSIGPLAAALSILHGSTNGEVIVILINVLAWGGFGIVAGLTMWGYRVITTIGKKITELTPTRGFVAEFTAASGDSLLQSWVCLSPPLKLVGAVTIPVGAVLSFSPGF